MNTLIVIPAFNSQKSINILIDKISKITDNDILIYDDGSIPELIIDESSSNMLKILRNKTNKGKGYTLKESFNYALINNYTHILTIDSDMQHDPSLISKFLKIEPNILLVIGRRYFTKPMPLHRRLSNHLTSSIISFLVKNRISDSQCGYRRYKISLLSDKEFKENGFQFESEILLKCINKNSSIEHINIPTIYNDSKSSIKSMPDTLKFIKLIGRCCFVR